MLVLMRDVCGGVRSVLVHNASNNTCLCVGLFCTLIKMGLGAAVNISLGASVRRLFPKFWE